MNKFAREHQDWILLICGIVFLAIIAWFAVAGVQLLLASVRLPVPKEGGPPELPLKLTEAKELLETFFPEERAGETQ